MGAVFSGGGIDISMAATADMDSYQYHFAATSGCTSGSVGWVSVGSGGSNPGPIGVLQNDPKINGPADIRVAGTTQLYVNAAGSTIHFGRLLTCGSDGHGELADYTPVAGGSALVAHAMALGHTTGDGVIIEALLLPYSLMISGS
jgi:hypothetical protein